VECSEPFGALCVTSWNGARALGAANWTAAGAVCRTGIAGGLTTWALSALVLQPTSIKLATARNSFGRMSMPILVIERLFGNCDDWGATGRKSCPISAVVELSTSMKG